MGQVLSGLGQQGGYGQRRSGTRQTGGGSPYGGIYGPNGDVPGYYLGGSGPGNGGNSGASTGYSDPLGGMHYGSGDPAAQKGGGVPPWVSGEGTDPRGGDPSKLTGGLSGLIGEMPHYGDLSWGESRMGNGGGAVEANLPDPIGTTATKEPENPMRKRRGGMQYTPETQRY